MSALLLILACGSGKVAVEHTGVTGPDPEPSAETDGTPEDTEPEGGEDSGDEGGDDTGGPEQVGGNGDTGPEEPEPDTWPRPCADIYDPDILPTFDLTFSDAELRSLNADCSAGSQSYHPVQFTYEDETVSAMVRLKGNWSWSCSKLQFVVSFNEEDSTGRFHGLRKIMLDAPWYDHTLLHERMAFPLFEQLGLPYSCVNNARVTINGEYYGLYANIERIDHEYLERNFEEYGGNLYQGGTELKTNEDVGDTSDLAALNAARTVEELEEVMDLDEAVAEWAAEAMLPAMDNYWAGVEINYYLYSHPSRGFLYLPYDLDISFGDAAYSDGSLVWPDTVNADPITYEHYGWKKESLLKTVLSDPTWCARFVEELELARAAYDPDEMVARVVTWDAQIAEALKADTHKPFSNSAHDTSISQLKAFFAARAAVVDAWLDEGDHCPARW